MQQYLIDINTGIYIDINTELIIYIYKYLLALAMY